MEGPEKPAGLKRELGLAAIFCIASGAMISSGLFILPGIAHARAGPSVVLSYLLAGIISLPGMLSIAEMTTAMPRAGGDCFTIMRSLGPGVGTVAGLLSWFSLAMKSAFALVGMSVFTVYVVHIDVHIVAVFFCVAFLVVNLVGIREAGRTQVALVAGLFALMLLYVVLGVPAVDSAKLVPFAPNGIVAVLSTTGFVFVSYAGLLKVASVAEEIKDAGRNIPLAMILSLLVVSLFYTLMVLVTAGVLDAPALDGTLTPITDGASAFMGRWGALAMSVAAILAFLSTANAGIMTAARSLVPLSRDGLLPASVGRVNALFGTPHNALLLTGIFVLGSLFIDLEILVEAASTVLIVTNILACMSVIILRESGLQNYRPTFRTPLYPWTQAAGIVALGFLVHEMGTEALVMSVVLVLAGVLVYRVYGRKRGYREYALLHLIERITARELTTRSLEDELKEIIGERDGIMKDRFDNVVEASPVLDVRHPLSAEEFFQAADETLREGLALAPGKVREALTEREAQGSTAISPFLAIPHIVVEGERHFSILIARCREGVRFSDAAPAVRAVFVLVGTLDERNLHLMSLAAIAQITQEPNFEQRWTKAKNPEALRHVVLLGKRGRHG